MKKDKNSKEKKVKKKSKIKTFFKILLLIILLVIIGYGLWFGYNYLRHISGDAEYDPLSATALGIDPEKLKTVGRINVLIMGESGIPGEDYKLTDSIMLASYNPQTQQASILSIPRDTYVGRKDRTTATQNYLASYKINAAYRNGANIEETVDLVSELTGIDIDNYVLIDTSAIIKIVDAIGGVTFDVPIDMDYDDANQDLHIHLKAGEQLIDGNKAEQLLRFRHNQDGSTYSQEYGDNDIGRMRTQREFIQATLKQLVRFENVTKFLNILDIVFDNIQTDLTMETIKYYVPYAFKFNMEAIQTGTLPGTSEQCNGIWLYVANKKQTKELVEEMFSDKIIENKEITNTIEGTNTNTIESTANNKEIKIELLNGSNSDTKLDEVKNKLIRAGYSVTKTGVTTSTAKSVIINRTMQTETVKKDLESILGITNVNNSSNNSKVDFTIIIGKDYK